MKNRKQSAILSDLNQTYSLNTTQMSSLRGGLDPTQPIPNIPPPGL